MRQKGFLVALVLALVLALWPPIARPTEAAVYTVNTVLDENDGSCSDGDCSLRDAIILANSSGSDIIDFDTSVFPLASPTTINILSSLPSIGSDTIIDGSNAGVILNGSGTPSGTTGLVIDGAINVVIKGLQILNFPGDGIVLQNGASNNIIGGTNATPGGSCTGDCNLISGNGTVVEWSDGVSIKNTGTMSNTVSGNYIGTDVSGTAALGNKVAGVSISDGAQWNIVGGDTPGERNLISGNGVCIAESWPGVMVITHGAMNNTVKGNYIGTDVNGTSALPNCHAVDIRREASYNIISDNLISGNEGIGVTIRRGAMHNVIVGNKIGTDVNGTSALPNHRGFRIAEDAQYNVIGGDTPGERNIISGNRTCGVLIAHSNPSWGPSMNNTVSGNYIGTDIYGTSPIGNVESGITIGWYAQYNIIGGATPGERNIISGNGGDGVLIMGTLAISNTISGNYIGTDASGIVALPNADDGFEITDGASYNVIGGHTPGERNIISGNGFQGVTIDGSGTMSNTVSGNYIGTDASGTADLGNTSDGVYISDGAQNNTVGPDNVIVYNGWDGVEVYGGSTISNTITQNSIFSNDDMGIDLTDGANGGIAAPVIFTTTLGSVNIVGIACASCIVEVFENNDTDGEGENYVGNTTATASGAFTVTASYLTQPYLTATATDAVSGTSEFSEVFTTTVLLAPPVYLPIILKLYVTP
jgi:CSLREA domain-containing protein